MKRQASERTWYRAGQRGSVAVTVAISMLALVTVGAAAIDASRAAYVRNSLQSTVDSALKAAAAAALSQPLGMTADEKQAESTRIVKAYIKSNNDLSAGLASYDLENSQDFSVTYTDTGTGPNEDSISATLNATIPLSFTKLLLPSISTTITGRVKRPRPMPLELALALDVTSSMSETLPGGRTKLAELKSAATDLTDYVLQSEFSKVGIIPFTQQVNIGPSFQGKPWLDALTRTFCDVPPCQFVCGDPTWGTCTSVDGTPTGCWVKNCSRTCQNCRTQGFTGCVPVRGKKVNKIFMPMESIATPTAPQYVGDSTVCQVPLFADLTTKADYNGNGATIIRDKINSLTSVSSITQGNTYIPNGLIWGWNMLDPAEPLTLASAETGSNQPVKSIVLITDGQNTWTPTGPINSGTIGPNPAMDDLTLRVCSNIKNAGIKISTVALNIGTGSTIDMLRQCASSSDDFYSVQNVSQLKLAFQKIGMSFSYNSLTQ